MTRLIADERRWCIREMPGSDGLTSAAKALTHAAVLTAALLFPKHSSCADVTAESLSAQAKRSTVYIQIKYPDLKSDIVTTDIGSGIVISRFGDVLTAAHVVEGWQALSNEDKERYPILGRIGTKNNPMSFRMKVEGYNKNAYIALLKFLGNDGSHFMAASYCLTRTVATGATIYGFGFPDNRDFTPVSGLFSNDSGVESYWDTSASFVHGMSGGPVYNAQGFVIGIVSGGLEGPVNFVTPIYLARDILFNNMLEVQECPPTGPLPQPPKLVDSGNHIRVDTGSTRDKGTHKCDEVVFADYSKIPAVFEQHSVCK